MIHNYYFDKIFMAIGVILTIIVGILTDCTLLSLISSITGVISVVLCSQRQLSFYVFGFIQILTYSIICYNENLYGKLFENVFYIVTMLIGLYIWLKHYDKDNNEVNVRTFKRTILTHSGLFIIISLFTILLYYILLQISDSHPFFDSLSTVIAFVAQILMILRYKESWYYWAMVNILCIGLWIMAKDYCIAMQYLFWFSNCLFGLVNWKTE